MLSNPKSEIHNIAAVIVAIIAQIELPKERWLSLFTDLLSMISSSNATARLVALKTLKEMGRIIDDSVLKKHETTIASALAHALRTMNSKELIEETLEAINELSSNRLLRSKSSMFRFFVSAWQSCRLENPSSFPSLLPPALQRCSVSKHSSLTTTNLSSLATETSTPFLRPTLTSGCATPPPKRRLVLNSSVQPKMHFSQADRRQRTKLGGGRVG